MILRDLILLAVWARVVNDLVQFVVHLITYVMLRRTKSADRFSGSLRQRELALGNKSLSGAGFDLLIAIGVTWGIDLTGAWFLPPIVGFTAIGAISASIFAIRFMIAYQQEHWGVRGREETKVERAARRTEQAATEIRHTAEDLRQSVVSDVLPKIAVDVEAVKRDVQAVKNKIVEGEVP